MSDDRTAAPSESGDGYATDDVFLRVDARTMAAGWLPGRVRAHQVPLESGDSDPLAVLERAVLPALERAPCVVGFSGGRDSSLILAIATRVAAREGLPPPLPVTKRFPRHPETDEDDWQEYVVRHLGLDEWVRQEFEDDLDLLGPASLASLRRFGPLWPATCHNRAPHLALAAGGSYLGGEGGDELLGEFRATPWLRLRATGLRPNVRTIKEITKVFGPRPVRRAVVRRSYRDQAVRPWLTPQLQQWYRRTLIEDDVVRPLSYTESLRDFLRRRAVRTALHNLHAMGEQLGVTYVQPLAQPGFAAALAASGGRFGYASRTATLRALFGDLLPDPVLARESKATFNSVYAHHHTREFIATWDGSGLDTDLVDVDVLRRTWQEPTIHGGTFQLLHLAWLASQEPGNPDRLDQRA